MADDNPFNHRICERCWFDGPKSVIELPEGVGFRTPVQVKGDPESLDVCCYCGGIVVTQIFVRDDPSEPLCQGRHKEEDLASWSRVGIG